jgi:hypothetical protein
VIARRRRHIVIDDGMALIARIVVVHLDDSRMIGIAIDHPLNHDWATITPIRFDVDSLCQDWRPEAHYGQ